MFKQRSDAFDFYSTLIDYREKLNFEKKVKTEEYVPKYDFSLKKEEEKEQKIDNITEVPAKQNNLNK